jgi:ABC-type transport system involved in multi-copper enzyme maturation permease subunit
MTSGSRFSLRELAAGSAGVFTFLAVFQLILICVLTPVFMAGAISKEANPKTWDILLTTPLSPLQIVLGNLFGRLFFILALLLGALPLMIVTQFFGGVPLQTILLTQLVAISLALIVAAAAIGMSVTRTAGRKAAVNFFIVTVLYLLLTYVVDHAIRVPVILGASSTWTTYLTPLNPFLVLEALLQPAGYVVPESSSLPWPFGWLVTHPVAGWVWLTVILSVSVVTWSSIQVRKLGDRSSRESFWKKLFQPDLSDRQPNTVSGNPISWRERVTRHRNIGSLIGRWGFVVLFGLPFLIVTALFFTKTMSGDAYRDVSLYMIVGEVLIIVFTSISLSASAIAKEREDGSLDLLLTTAITPKLYLGGKMKGLVLHLLPMVLVPCFSMMLIGLVVLVHPEGAVVSDLWDVAKFGSSQPPLALFIPALLFPIIFIPYITFCMTLGLLWSMRSKGSISAIVTTLVLVLVVTGGLSVCLLPVQGIHLLGIGFSSLSPLSTIFVTLSPVQTLPKILGEGILAANVNMGIAIFIAGCVWSLVSYGLLRSMASSFVVTVRRLAGNN